jgi:hypothetical protein
VEVVVAPHLDQLEVGIVDLEFLQWLQQAAIAVLAWGEISQPQSVPAHFLFLQALAASAVVIDSLEASLSADHKGSVVEVAVFLVATPPPSFLLLSVPSPLPLQTAFAAAIADSLGRGRSSPRKCVASPKGYKGFRETALVTNPATRSLCLYSVCICMKP